VAVCCVCCVSCMNSSLSLSKGFGIDIKRKCALIWIPAFKVHVRDCDIISSVHWENTV